MAADALVTQGARASAAMVLTVYGVGYRKYIVVSCGKETTQVTVLSPEVTRLCQVTSGVGATKALFVNFINKQSFSSPQLRGMTTTGSALDGAMFDITQILAYLVHNMSRSQLYLGFAHFG